jgi:hypothetical protein
VSKMDVLKFYSLACLVEIHGLYGILFQMFNTLKNVFSEHLDSVSVLTYMDCNTFMVLVIYFSLKFYLFSKYSFIYSPENTILLQTNQMHPANLSQVTTQERVSNSHGVPRLATVVAQLQTTS